MRLLGGQLYEAVRAAKACTDVRMVTELQERIRELEQQKSAPSASPIQHPPLVMPLPRDTRDTPSPSRIQDSYWSSSAVDTEDNLPQLPSNSQLLDQFPSSVGIPSPLFENHNTVQGVLPAEFGALPPRHTAWQLMQHFLTCTNIPFPIHHVPTLEATLDNVYRAADKASADDFLVICCERPLVLADIDMLALAAVSLPKHSPLRTWYRQGDRPAIVGHADLYAVASSVSPP